MKHLFMFYVVFFGALFTVAYWEQNCTDAPTGNSIAHIPPTGNSIAPMPQCPRRL